MITRKHDEDVMSQLLAFGYSKQDIINASQQVINHRDINAVQQQIDATSNNKTLSPNLKKTKSSTTSGTNSLIKHTNNYTMSANTTPTKTKRTDDSWIKCINNDKHDPSVSDRYARKASIITLKKRGALSKACDQSKKLAINTISEDTEQNHDESTTYLWLKQNVESKYNHMTPTNSQPFSRKASIMKLKQIASISKGKEQPQQATLIDAVFADDQSFNKWLTANKLEIPGSNRRRCALFTDTTVKTNKNPNSWIARKQTVRNKAVFNQRNHIQSELSLLFDFRDFESKNNITKQFEENIKKIQNNKTTEATELMRKKTFNHVRLKHDIKQKAISGFETRLIKQKKLMEAGFTAVPLLNDNDFVKDDDEMNNEDGNKQKKLSRRHLLKQALKDEQTAIDHCVMIVEELGFLKYMKDNAEYMQLMKSKENAMRIAREKKQQNLGPATNVKSWFVDDSNDEKVNNNVIMGFDLDALPTRSRSRVGVESFSDNSQNVSTLNHGCNDLSIESRINGKLEKERMNAAEVQTIDVNEKKQSNILESAIITKGFRKQKKSKRNIVIVITKNTQHKDMDKTSKLKKVSIAKVITNHIQKEPEEIEQKEEVKEEVIKEEIKPKHKMKGGLAAKFGDLNFDPTKMKVGAAPPRREREKREMDQSVIMNKAMVLKKRRRKRRKKKVIIIDDEEEEKTIVSASLFSINMVEEKQDENKDKDEDIKELTIKSQAIKSVFEELDEDKDEDRDHLHSEKNNIDNVWTHSVEKKPNKSSIIDDDAIPDKSTMIRSVCIETPKNSKKSSVNNRKTAITSSLNESLSMDQVPIRSTSRVEMESEDHKFNMDFNVNRSRSGVVMVVKKDIDHSNDGNENIWNNEQLTTRSRSRRGIQEMQQYKSMNSTLDLDIWNNMKLPIRSRSRVGVEAQNNVFSADFGKSLMENDNNKDVLDENKDKNDIYFECVRSRSGAFVTLYSALAELKDEEHDKKRYDLFCMNNSNLLLSLKRVNAHLLMRVLSKSFIMIKSLRFIQLSNCGVNDYFMSQIILQFMENINDFRINTLDLQSNNIGDNGMLCLCELIRINNKYLNVIRLQNNKKNISTGVCKQICDALEINDYIIKFGFEFRHYAEKDKSYRALKKNMDNARIKRIENI